MRTFTTAQDGLYDIAVEAARGKDAPQRARAFVRAAPDDREYFDAAMRPTFLRPRSPKTPAAASTRRRPSSTLPEDITYLGRGVTVVQEKDLWDMPVVLLLLVGLVGGEWALRRRWGLA